MSLVNFIVIAARCRATLSEIDTVSGSRSCASASAVSEPGGGISMERAGLGWPRHWGGSCGRRIASTTENPSATILVARIPSSTAACLIEPISRVRPNLVELTNFSRRE